MTSPYLSFFLALDNLPRLDASVLADRLGRDYQQFLQRRWVVPAGHLTHVMVPFWAAAGFDDTLLRWQMKPEVVNGEKKDIQSRVQTRGGQTGR